ncbi:MAG: hypothetical protein M0C28_40285 [Candidatus Moduliflexus flocculans]|nr:hypothetical protein [Candidatus Moduliflexus flocculans]
MISEAAPTPRPGPRPGWPRGPATCPASPTRPSSRSRRGPARSSRPCARRAAASSSSRARPGCGKSTQIPKMCLEAGRGIARADRRHPAAAASRPVTIAAPHRRGDRASRIGQVGRLQDPLPGRGPRRDGYIKVMTDGILLAETAGRPAASTSTTRSSSTRPTSAALNIDFLLGIVRTPARPSGRDLQARHHVGHHRHGEVLQGLRRTPRSSRSAAGCYPVEVRVPRARQRRRPRTSDYVDQAVEAVEYLIVREKPPGDILVFMPTEQDIRETCRHARGTRSAPAVTVLPLFARLTGGRAAAASTPSPAARSSWPPTWPRPR